jgi:hypothetical protein
MFMLRNREIVALVSRMACAFALAAAPLVSTTARAGDDAPPASAPIQAAPAAPAAPGQDEGFFRNMMKKAGVVTDPDQPADFVVKSRPAAPTDFVPVFRKPEEHQTKVLTPDQLKAMEADLDAASTRDARLRDGFAPSRRAYIEQQRQKAQKAAKHAKTPAAKTPAANTPAAMTAVQ